MGFSCGKSEMAYKRNSLLFSRPWVKWKKRKNIAKSESKGAHDIVVFSMAFCKRKKLGQWSMCSKERTYHSVFSVNCAGNEHSFSASTLRSLAAIESRKVFNERPSYIWEYASASVFVQPQRCWCIDCESAFEVNTSPHPRKSIEIGFCTLRVHCALYLEISCGAAN